MENASKALLMAAGILVGILILSLMTTLFVSSKQLSTTYDKTKNEEAIQRFNANFIKYLGRELTIHEVVTISNFAELNGVEVYGAKTKDEIKDIVKEYPNMETYTLKINSYSDDGYVDSISFD